MAKQSEAFVNAKARCFARLIGVLAALRRRSSPCVCPERKRRFSSQPNVARCAGTISVTTAFGA